MDKDFKQIFPQRRYKYVQLLEAYTGSYRGIFLLGYGIEIWTCGETILIIQYIFVL